MEGETTLNYNDERVWHPRSLSHLYTSDPLIINDATLYFEPKESSKNYTMDFTPVSEARLACFVASVPRLPRYLTHLEIRREPCSQSTCKICTQRLVLGTPIE
jgi:hypothetical protein